MAPTGAVDPLLLRAWQEVAEGLMVLDAGDWRIVHVNDAGAAVYGLTRDDLTGRLLGDVFPAAVGSEFHRQLRRTRTEPGVVRWTGPVAGTTRWIEVRAQNLDGRVLCAYRDVTREHGVAAERDSLLISLQTSLDRTEALLDLSHKLTATVTVQDVAAAVVEVARTGFGAAFAALSVVDHERQLLRTPFTGPLAPGAEEEWTDLPLDGPGPGTLALRDGQPRFDDAASLRATFPELRHRWDAAGVRYTTTVPLVAAGRNVGLLTMVWQEDQSLSENQRALLVALASYTTQALLRALLLAERTATGRTLQNSMVTADLPGADGLTLCSRYLAARAGEQVGGDWFDGILLPDGTTLVVIGDVTGHDITAAAAMGQLRIALRALAVDRHDPPGQLLSRLEAVVDSLGGEPILASAVVGRIEPPPVGGGEGGAPRGERVLRWANAGHPPPVLVHADGTVELLERDPDLLLGVTGTTRTDHVVAVPEGSTLLLYTDGLVERRGSDLAEGTARLLAAAPALGVPSPGDRTGGARDGTARDAGADVAAGLDALLLRLEGDCGLPGGAGREDDVALLAVRFGPQDRDGS